MRKILNPEDLDAERALIATLAAPGTLDPGEGLPDAHQAVLSCPAEVFVHPSHRAVYEAIQALYADGQDINALTLKARLANARKLDAVGGYAGLVEILAGEEVARPSALVQRLLDLWRFRRVMRLGARACETAASQSQPIDDLIAELASELSSLVRGSESNRIRKASALLDRLHAGEAFRDPSAHGKLLWTGMDAIDEAVEASSSHVVIIAARPGVGKSALAVQSQWATARRGIPSLLISLEMDRHELESRYASWESWRGQRDFRRGDWDVQTVQTLSNAAPVMDLMHHWVAASNAPWPKVESVIRDAVRVHGVRAVLIDHALLIAKPNLGRNSNDAACWTALSRSIKRLAQELSICMAPLCQLSRAGDAVEPKLSDLKETGGWEEDANAVVMLWPKDAKAEDDPHAEAKDVMVKVAKNRSGPAGWKREVEFRGAINRLTLKERVTTFAPSTQKKKALL